MVKLIEEVKSVSGKDVFGNLIELKEFERVERYDCNREFQKHC